MLFPATFLFSKADVSQRKCAPNQSFTIEIYAGMHHSVAIWRIAKLSFDATADTNLISPRLVTEVLGLTISPLEKGCNAYAELRSEEEADAQGYVDLVWSFETSRKIFEPTRFVVTSTYDPPFDAVLGRGDSIKHGLVRDCG